MLNRIGEKVSASARVRIASNLSALACSLLLVFGTVLHAEGRVVKRKVPPVYPDIAKTMHIEGVVMVSATVNAGGDVVNAKAEGGNKLLSLAAQDAVKRWKFLPGPDQTIEQVEIVFKLGQ